MRNASCLKCMGSLPEGELVERKNEEPVERLYVMYGTKIWRGSSTAAVLVLLSCCCYSCATGAGVLGESPTFSDSGLLPADAINPKAMIKQVPKTKRKRRPVFTSGILRCSGNEK